MNFVVGQYNSDFLEFHVVVSHNVVLSLESSCLSNKQLFFLLQTSVISNP